MPARIKGTRWDGGVAYQRPAGGHLWVFRTPTDAIRGHVADAIGVKE